MSDPRSSSHSDARQHEARHSDARHHGPLAAAVALVFLVLGWLGNAPFTASNSNDYVFDERIDFGTLFGDMLDVSVIDVINTAFTDNLLLPLLNILFLASATAMLALALLPNLRTKRSLMAATALAVPYGLLAMPVLLVGGFDGEFVEEGWTALAVCAPWLAFLIGCSVVLWRADANAFPDGVDSARQPATT